MQPRLCERLIAPQKRQKDVGVLRGLHPLARYFLYFPARESSVSLLGREFIYHRNHILE